MRSTIASLLFGTDKAAKAPSVYPAAISSPKTVALVFVALALAALYPLLTVEIPPLVDYANHLARYHVIARIDETPALQSFYEVHWALLPNLALDLVAPLLMKVLPPYEAGRLIVAITILLLVGGVFALQFAVFGRTSLWAAAGFLFVFNFVLAWGFLNYLLTIALALFAIAAWVGLRRRSPWLRLPLFAAIATGLFFGHLLACAAYGIFIAAYEAEKAFRGRRAPVRDILRNGAVAAGQFAIPFALWIVTSAGSGETYTVFSTLSEKIIALFSPLMFFDTLFERISIVVIGALLIRGLFGKYIVIAPGFAWPLIALAVVTVLLPNTLFSVAKVDFRLTPLLALLLIGVSELRLPNRRYAVAVAGVGLVLFGVRVGTVADSWQAFDRSYAEFRVAATRIEPGARILSVQDRPGNQRHPHEAFYWHLANLATIDRGAFSPTFFADPAKHPVRIRPAARSIHAPDVEPISVETFVAARDPKESAALEAIEFRYNYRPFWAFWTERFDYVVLMHFGRPVANPVPAHLTRIVEGSYFDLYRVIR